MTKLVLGVIFLGLVNLTYSQRSDRNLKVIKLTGVEVSAVNQIYMNEVLSGAISETVYILESEAANYKIERSASYNDNYIYGDFLNKTYNVQFSKQNGEIMATYDRNGNIIYTAEKYQDLTPPSAVRNSAYMENPDWSLNSTAYLVYFNGKDAKKIYKIELMKDKQKKVLKFDVDGNRID